MPKIRYGRGFPDNCPPEFSSVTERFYYSSDGTIAESQLFPEVPMNSQVSATAILTTHLQLTVSLE